MSIHPIFTDSQMARLEAYGLNYALTAEIKRDRTLGRVIARHGDLYQVATSDGIIDARTSGSFAYRANDENDFPVVGDWVLCPDGKIQTVLPRTGLLCRRESGAAKQPGRIEHGQLMCANIQAMFIVWPCSRDPRGYGLIGRFLVVARSSGMRPLVILTKGDLLDREERSALMERSKKIWPDIEICMVSTGFPRGGENLDSMQAIAELLEKGEAGVLVGLSGAGKSSIVQELFALESEDKEKPPDSLRIQEISEFVQKGKHTTTHREMFRLPGGGLLVDNPGIREVGLWIEDPENEVIDDSFSVISETAVRCKFRDCRHEAEPGCAVRTAIDEGLIEKATLVQYRKLEKEVRHVATRSIEAAGIRASHAHQKQKVARKRPQREF